MLQHAGLIWWVILRLSYQQSYTIKMLGRVKFFEFVFLAMLSLEECSKEGFLPVGWMGFLFRLPFHPAKSLPNIEVRNLVQNILKIPAFLKISATVCLWCECENLCRWKCEKSVCLGEIQGHLKMNVASCMRKIPI